VFVSSGGTADSTTVNSGGGMVVSSGGTATEIKENGGYVNVADGANATFTSNSFSGLNLSNAFATVHSGTTATDTTLNFNGRLYVSSGGTADNTIVNSSGYFDVYSGGTANNTTVNSWGYLYVSNGGTANNITVNTLGYLIVSSGGMANSTTVNRYGYLYITNGGTATDIVWTPCEGHVSIFAGGYATFASEYSGVYYGSNNQLLSNAAVMNGRRIDDFCEVNVMSGGTVNSTIVDSGGQLHVFSGGTATEIMENGGYVEVADGADVTFVSRVLRNLQLRNSSATIHSGTTAVNATVLSDVSLLIFSGGTARNTLVSGMSAAVIVSDGGTANSTTVNSWGYLYVSSGGTADSTIIYPNGNLHVSSGGTANSTTVNTDGRLYVSNGGTATNIIASRGASISFAPGAVLQGTYDGRAFTVNDSGVSGFVFRDGGYDVSKGKLVEDSVVAFGGLHISSGGIVSNTSVTRDGRIIVSSGGTADHTTVDSGGQLQVFRSGTADSTTVNAGGMYVSIGGIANSTTVNSRGYLSVDVSGTVNSVTVNTGGRLVVTRGGTATEIRENGGSVDVKGGANVTFALNVFSGLVLSNASATVHSGTTANQTTVAKGSLTIFSGGTADSVVVSGGSLYISSGGKLTGRILCVGGGISVLSGSILDFDLTQTSQGAGARINDFAKIHGTGYTVTLTVNADQADGVYKLAEGAANFDQTITVVNMAGDELGTLAVGETADISGVDYTLSLSDGKLSLKVGESEPPSPYTSNGFILSGGTAAVESGEVFHDTLIYSASIFSVNSGGTADTTRVFSGSMSVSSGGAAADITVSGGRLIVMDGGFADHAVVQCGGQIYISSGGTAVNILENGGYVAYEDGAEVSFVPNVLSNAVFYSNEKSNKATLHSGTTACNATISGNLYVSGGMLDGAIAASSASVFVCQGGTAKNLVMDSKSDLRIIVSSGGTAINTVVNDSRPLQVQKGAILDSTTINSGVSFQVNSGVTMTNIIENGGNVTVTSGAVVTFASNTFEGLCLFSGSATVHSGTTALRTVINTFGNSNSSAYLTVYEGGVARETVINGSGRLLVSSGGTADNTTVYSGGSLLVSRGGTAINTTLEVGGRLIVSGGGTANSTTLNWGGGLTVTRGGTAVNTTINVGAGLTVEFDGSATQIKENGGYVYVRGNDQDHVVLSFIPNTFSDVVLISNQATVHSGTTANNITLEYGGGLYVYSGGIANSTTVNSVGPSYSGGGFFVYSGGMANNTTVNSGGTVFVSSGGTANNTTVNSRGSMYVSSGGKLTGKMIFESGASVFASEGAILDFDLTQVEAGEMALVNDLSIIQGTPLYTLTVDADSWKPGSYTYSLADGAYNFASTISVMNAAGDELGVLTVGETVRIGYDDYTLNLNEWALTVTVEVPDLPPTAPDGLRSFVDGQDVALLWNLSTDDYSGVKEYVVTYSLDGQEYTVRTQNTHYVLNGADYGTWSWSVRAVDFAGNESEVSVGEAFTVSSFQPYIVEYSTDSFEHVLRLKVSSAALDSFRLPTGTYEWRMRAESEADWQTGDPIVSVADSTPTFVQSDADGADDLFFANASGVWETGYLAQHGGSIGDWDGTLEYAAVFGKNKLADIFEGSDDANILLLTDDLNGDGLFVDDIYTELPGTLEEQQARIARIDEIRAGAGDDIVDMTSQRFEYIGDGILLRGGDGNDVLWANKGENTLFGDAGNDRIVGASGDDLIAGGIGDDRMHGGGGDDVFAFCENWGTDTVEQLATGSVTLWFASGDLANWHVDTLTYSDGENCVQVKGVTAEQVTLKFGDDGSAQFTSLSDMGAFDAFTSRKIFEEATLA